MLNVVFWTHVEEDQKRDQTLNIYHTSGSTEAHAIDLLIYRKQELEDLRKVLQRALNCWDDAPKWLIELSDALEKTPIPAVHKQEGQK